MSDHKVAIRYSNDGPNNWNDWRIKDAGEAGDFVKELVWRRLGMCRHRVWEFRDDSPFPGDVLAAMLHIEGE